MQKVPPVFKKIKEKVLGSRYDLSVALISPAAMRRAMKYKKLTAKKKLPHKASNVLAFPLSKTSGEILICPDTAKKEAPLYGMSQRMFLAYLFIHGCLHLKGRVHGVTMERNERRVLTHFGFRRADE